MMAPEYNEMKIDVTEDSLMTLMFQYEMHNMNEILVEVTDLMNFDMKLQPIDHHVNEQIVNSIVEHSYSFSLQKGREYRVVLTFLGETLRSRNRRLMCDYYSLSISINHFTSLKNSLSCQEKGMYSRLVEDFPRQLTDKDFDHKGNYHLSDIYEVKYPNDFFSMANAKSDPAKYGISKSI